MCFEGMVVEHQHDHFLRYVIGFGSVEILSKPFYCVVTAVVSGQSNRQEQFFLSQV